MTKAEFEAALDAGTLEILEFFTHENRYRWYKVHRNGATRVWKRDPSRFSIPIKYKFNCPFRVNEKNFEAGTIDRWFRIAGPDDTKTGTLLPDFRNSPEGPIGGGHA